MKIIPSDQVANYKVASPFDRIQSPSEKASARTSLLPPPLHEKNEVNRFSDVLSASEKGMLRELFSVADLEKSIGDTSSDSRIHNGYGLKKSESENKGILGTIIDIRA